MAPVKVVVPAVVVIEAGPVRPLTVPPVEVTAPVSAPLVSVPPFSATALIVSAKPPRLRMPPVATLVALPALKVLAAPASAVPPLIAVAPV